MKGEMIIAIIAWTLIAGTGIYTVISMLLHRRRMVKYDDFIAELEAQEDEWERIRTGR